MVAGIVIQYNKFIPSLLKARNIDRSIVQTSIQGDTITPIAKAPPLL